MKGGTVVVGVLMIALATLIGAHWWVLPDPSRRNWEFFPDMVESAAVDAQSPAFVLADGTPVDLRPAPGTVARGFLPFGFPATPEGASAAALALENPFRTNDGGAAARGKVVYDNFCAVCHGWAGHGDGAVTRKGVPPPPSLLLDHAIEMTDGRMYHVITAGQGNMGSYASQVERDDRWRAILHVRSLQQAGATPPAAPAATVASATASGSLREKEGSP